MATQIKKIDINPSVGSLLKVEKRDFIIIKVLKNKLRAREIFCKPNGKKVKMSFGDFYEISNISSSKS